MEFKIDTKEKMHVILLKEDYLTANMSEQLENTCSFYLGQPIKNVVVNLSKVSKIDNRIMDSFLKLQQSFTDAGVSLVFCCLHKDIRKMLEEKEMEDVINWTPTESEAWDIVQMEEIEREYL